ncbi:autotransporter domain-containing protein [Sphingopyxis chilensis]
MSRISKSRLLATSAIVGLSIGQVVAPAAAQESFGIHNDQPELLEIVVAEDEEVEGLDIGIYADNGPVTVDNAGEIRGNGTSVGSPDSRPSGGIVIAQPGSSVTNSGTITGGSNGIATSYFFSEDENDDELPPEARAADTTVVNTGLIRGDAGTGVALAGGGSVTNNDGLIQGFNGAPGSGVNGIGVIVTEFPDAIAEDVTGIGTITNIDTGIIEGQTFGVILQGGGTIDNDGGTIRATGQFNPAIPGAQAPIGIVMNATPEQVGRSATLNNEGVVLGLIGVLAGGSLETTTINNEGIINGAAVAIFGQSNGELIVNNGEGAEIASGGNGIQAATSQLTVDNAGTIRGDSQNGINILTADAVITNSGTITGGQSGVATNVQPATPTTGPQFVAFNAAVNNSGTITGTNNAGIRLTGGGTVDNSGSISGLGGDGIYVGTLATGVTTINNAEDGTITGAASGVHAELGGLDLTNAGSIHGDGVNPGFDAPPDAGVTISGGVSTVTNSGSITGNRFGITTANYFNAATGQLQGLATGTTVVNSGTIYGYNDDGVRLIGGGSVTNSGEIGGQIDAFADGVSMFAYTDQANEDYSALVTNETEGRIIGVRFGVILSGGGEVVNDGEILGASGGVYIQGTALNTDPNEERSGLTANVVNRGTITGLGDFGGTGTEGYGVGFGSDMSTATLVNSGTISSEFAEGVSHGSLADLTITNEAGGVITGATSGIYSGSSGTLTVDNAGTIRGDGAYDGFDAAPDAGITIGTAASSVTNSGTISGAGAGITTAYVFDEELGALVGLAVGTEVTNSGSILGEANDGVRLIGGGIVTNSGSIRGEGTAFSDGISMYAFVDQANEDFSASVVNAEGGEIGGARFGIILSGGGSVENAGDITGADGGMFLQGTAINTDPGEDRSGLTASVVNRGTITGTRDDGLNGYGVGFGSDLSTATLDNSGTISSVAGAGVFHGTLGDVTITNSADGVIEGAAYGVYADGEGTLDLINAGTIQSAGTGIESTTQTSLTNNGSIAGDNGVAVLLGAFDDSVTLGTGSAISGLVDAGEGIDTLTLDGDVLELTEAQQLTAANGFEALDVAAGYWSTSGFVGEFGNVTIDEGAALQVNEVDLGEEGTSSPILTSTVRTDGLLVLNFGEDETVSALDDLTIDGAGQLQLIGEAVFTVDTANIAHTGGTIVSNGGLVLTGVLQGDVKTEGDGYFELGAGGTEGSFAGNIVNDGRFVFNRSDDYDFLGDFSGNGVLDKKGDGALTFMGDYAFEGVTNILGGSVRIGGTIDPTTDFNLGDGGTLDITGKDQTIGGLEGEEGSNVEIGDNQLTVDQPGNTAFGGSISGAGSFVKQGEGTLNLTGDSTYSGPTSVDGGTLAVNGSIVSPVTVNSGGTLGGNGSVGSTTVGDGGTLAPGNSIGRLTVNGDLAFAPGSTYEVEVNAAGEADRLDATGAVTIDSTASVAVLAEEGEYNGRTDYVILTGAGGITGTFGTVTSDLAFLDPLLRYDANSVILSLYRNDIDFADIAVGFNQASVATAVQALGVDNPLYEAVLVQNAATAQASFGDLSGEILASSLSGLTDDSRHLRNSLMGMRAPEESGAFVWGSAFGGWGDFDANRGNFAMDTDHKGLVAGVGFGGNGFAAGLSAGIGGSDFRFDGRNDRAEVDSKYLAAHATYGSGEGLRGTVGVSYAWHDIDTSRGISGAPLAQTLTSKRDADTLQIFGEIGYDIVTGNTAVTPFARLAHVDTGSDAFTEAGGNAALTVGKADQKATFLSLGARAQFNAGQPGFQPYLSAAWNRAFNDRGAPIVSRFVAGGPAFDILGIAIPKNSAEVEAGFEFTTGAFRLGAAYTGTLASDRSAHGARVTARIAF